MLSFLVPSVDNALRHFHKAHAALKKAMVYHDRMAIRSTKASVRLNQLAEVHSREVARAVRHMDKIEEFIK